MSYTLEDLRATVHAANGAHGRASNQPDQQARVEARHNLAVAKLALAVAKNIDDADIELTQDDASHICNVLASRVVS